MKVTSLTRYGSIITRLTIMVALIVVTAVGVSGGLALFGQQRQVYQALVTKAATLVQFVAQVTPLSLLSLNFVEMNNNTKKVVLTDDDAVYAIILNGEGIPLAYFFKESDPLVTGAIRTLVKERQPLSAIKELKRSGYILEVSSPINAGERRIGTATLGFCMEKMKAALLTQFAVIGGIAVAIIAMSIVFLELALRRILHPVQALTAAATRISTGDLNVVLTGTDQADELGVLSRAFESMAGQLRELIAGLEEREHDLQRVTIFQRTILDNAAYGIIATGADGKVSSFNHAAERLLGYSAGEVVGKMMPISWHDPKELTAYARELSDGFGIEVPMGAEVFLVRPRRNLPEEREWTFIRKDGARVPVLLSVTALNDEEGCVTGFVGLTYDLTERKRSEAQRRESDERYRRIVDTAIEGICWLGADTMIVFVNARMVEMLGYAEAEILGRSLADFMFEEDIPDHDRKMESRRRGLTGNYERRFRRRDGATVWTLASAAPIFDDQGEFQGSFGMFTDITVRKQAEEELRRLKDQLEVRVQERTSELEAKNVELERMNKLFIGRELRMIELKQQIRDLEDEKAPEGGRVLEKGTGGRGEHA